MCAHLVLRSQCWPADTVWEPCTTMEDSIEYFFGQVKTVGLNQGTAGSTTIANAIQNMQLIHTRQQRLPSKVRILNRGGWG